MDRAEAVLCVFSLFQASLLGRRVSCISCGCCEGFRGEWKGCICHDGRKRASLKGVGMSLQGPEADFGTDQKTFVKLGNVQVFKNF